MQLTVIIPVYNRSSMLAQALKSLEKQTYQDFKIIVCDDASQENLREVVDRFKSLDIEYHYYSSNVGQFKNFQRGEQLCQTPLMKFLYSDDLLFPSALEKQVSQLNQNSNAAVCLGGYIEFKEDRSQQDVKLKKGFIPYLPKPRRESQWAELEKLNCFFPSAVMYRTDLFRQVGGINTGLQGIADWEIYLALLSRYPSVAVSDPICAMRRHDDQVTTQYNLDSGGIQIHDVLWMTSDANPDRDRVSLPLSQQDWLRQQICWRALRTVMTSDKTWFLFQKWLNIVIKNNMPIAMVFGFPHWLFVKINHKLNYKLNACNNFLAEDKLKDYQKQIEAIILEN
ncbi:MAG: glycosyltransferase family 2 protein [Cyanobacteriota bacterium]|nr:glycosyltransferase family 2 protein [Cyanobacteriota bacterium]